MKRDPLEDLIIAFVVLNLLALLTGCATRSYVDWKDTAHGYLSQTEAICIYADLSQPAVDKILEMDERISRLEEYESVHQEILPPVKRPANCGGVE